MCEEGSLESFERRSRMCWVEYDVVGRVHLLHNHPTFFGYARDGLLSCHDTDSLATTTTEKTDTIGISIHKEG